jgi:hypothetical protein
MTDETREFIETELLTTQELSAYTGIKPAALKRRVLRGTIDYVLKGNTYLFAKSDFPPVPRRRRPRRPPPM